MLRDRQKFMRISVMINARRVDVDHPRLTFFGQLKQSVPVVLFSRCLPVFIWFIVVDTTSIKEVVTKRKKGIVFNPKGTQSTMSGIRTSWPEVGKFFSFNYFIILKLFSGHGDCSMVMMQISCAKYVFL